MQEEFLQLHSLFYVEYLQKMSRYTNFLFKVQTYIALWILQVKLADHLMRIIQSPLQAIAIS